MFNGGTRSLSPKSHRSSLRSWEEWMAPRRHGLQMNATALGQDLSPEEEKQRAELMQGTKLWELAAWGKFGVFEPGRPCNASEQIEQTRWVFTWEMADGRKSVKARLVAKGKQDPDLQEAIVDTSGRVSLFR